MTGCCKMLACLAAALALSSQAFAAAAAPREPGQATPAPERQPVPPTAYLLWFENVPAGPGFKNVTDRLIDNLGQDVRDDPKAELAKNRPRERMLFGKDVQR